MKPRSWLGGIFILASLVLFGYGAYFGINNLQSSLFAGFIIASAFVLLVIGLTIGGWMPKLGTQTQ